MSSADDPFELQQRVLSKDSADQTPGSKHHIPLDALPENLHRAHLRLEFPPSYVLVGVYRLFTDPTLYKPAWEKCRNGTRRGLVVGLVWAALTFGLQRKFIEVFLNNSPRIVGLSGDSFFGFRIPFSIHTYAALVYTSQQVTSIISFFLSKNIRIARDRAWNQTVASRNKGEDFFRGYVEEWENPPNVELQVKKRDRLKKWAVGRVGLMVIKKALLLPLGMYPFLGPLVSAWFKALGTAHFLHRQCFAAKKMTPYEVAVFMEERKWDYRWFGFVAALLEGLPLIGLVFTVSNRIGAAMWAFDLEKRQHFVAEEIQRERRGIKSIS